MRGASLAAALLSVLGTGCLENVPEPAEVNAAPVPKDTRKREPVGCAIRGEPTCELGQAPRVAVALTNRTDADIYLVGSLDGSDLRWRFPHCYFEVSGPGGTPVESGVKRCGNVNPLRVKDFVKVPPGGTFDPYQRIDDYGFFSASQLWAENFRAPGVYRIRFVYSTKGGDAGQRGGDDGREAAADTVEGMLRRVPKVEVRSNEIEVTVTARGK